MDQLSSNALTTLETAKDHLGIPSSDTSQDKSLSLLISGASNFIEKKTNRRFGKGTYTETYDASGRSPYLYLKAAPVTAFTSLSIDGTAVAAGDMVRYDEVGKLYYKNGVWPQSNQGITVVYSGGYVLPKDATEINARTLPADLELACLMLVDGALNRKGAGGVASSGSGSMNVSFEKIYNDDVKALISPYRYYNV